MIKEPSQIKTFSTIERFVDDILIWLDAKDAANQTLRMALKTLARSNVDVPATPSIAKLPFNAENMTWNATTGNKGPFELCKDYGNSDYQALLGFLKTHAGGSISSGGYFYWVFSSDGKTIGRKPSRRAH